MSYILATVAEVKLEVQYRLWASQFNNLENYASFIEFLQDANWYSREMIDTIRFSATYDY